MKLMRARKWMTLAAMVSGTAFQLTACRDEAGLFGTRVAFSSIFLPLNNMIVFFFSVLQATIQQFISGIIFPTI